MKILLVNKFFYLKGGAEKYMFSLADALKNVGHEVIFFSMKDEKNEHCSTEKYFVSKRDKSGSFIQKIRMVTQIAYSKEAYKKMMSLLKNEKPDLVILNNIHKQLTCSIIDAIKDYDSNLKIFWTVHDLITICPSYTMLDGRGNICEKCSDGEFKHCIENRCIQQSLLMSYLATYEAKTIKANKWYDKIDLFICPSYFYKEKLEKAHFTKSKIVSIRNPLPLKTRYEINDSDKGYILYFGRLSKEKGLKTLVDAMKNIKYRLYIVGTGPLENELKEYAKDCKNVEFKGFQSGENLSNYIKCSRCVVIPSEWYENGPYSAMETMALGKPLIVSNKGGLPELVQHNGNGFIYSNADELKKYLIDMINLSKEEYYKMCQESYNYSIEKFNVLRYVEELIEATKSDKTIVSENEDKIIETK